MHSGCEWCPPCLLSEELGLPHVCVTGNPAHPDGAHAGSDLRVLMYRADVGPWSALMRALNAHPARPRCGPFSLRVLERGWCSCGHSPAPQAQNAPPDPVAAPSAPATSDPAPDRIEETQ